MEEGLCDFISYDEIETWVGWRGTNVDNIYTINNSGGSRSEVTKGSKQGSHTPQYSMH